MEENKMTNIPRAEHPNPQFKREQWRNLNGAWEFEIEKSSCGKGNFSKQIIVPFCPESSLSGLGIKDFMETVWYQRTVMMTEKELSGDVLLHFGAVDYQCTVYVNGEDAGTHQGGYSSFELDITKFLKVGDNQLTVRVVDDVRNPLQPSGKQSEKVESFGCYYTRTTGIWQTVWLEFVPKKRLNSIRLTPNVEACSVLIEADANADGNLQVECFYEERLVGSREIVLRAGVQNFELQLSEKHLWEIGNGRLYDLQLTFGEDRVSSYFGLRSIQFDGMKFLLNGQTVFQRLVLDQGFYPDGICTARDDETLLRDIQLSKAMGFNGARLHEKVFEQRFLYHCDREGYMVWGEYPNWGIDMSRPEAVHIVLKEWTEVLNRDYNHPSIVGWCPMNETWDYNGRRQYDPNIATIYYVTKAVDRTRPCIDTSGGVHVVTDIFDVHDYDQDHERFREHYDKFMTDGKIYDYVQEYHSIKTGDYKGEPLFVSEYGGIAWKKEEGGWGYGDMPKSEEEFLKRFEGLTMALLNNKKMFGFCYTQLYDIEQEMNGLYTYERKAKFPAETIAKIVTRPATIELE